MSIIELKRNSVPIDLRVKIEHIMRDENLSWKETTVFWPQRWFHPLAKEILVGLFLCQKVVSPIVRQGEQSEGANGHVRGEDDKRAA